MDRLTAGHGGRIANTAGDNVSAEFPAPLIPYLLFCESPPVEHDRPFVHDAGVSEVRVIYEPVETAFSFHDRRVRDFFERAL